MKKVLKECLKRLTAFKNCLQQFRRFFDGLRDQVQSVRRLALTDLRESSQGLDEVTGERAELLKVNQLMVSLLLYRQRITDLRQEIREKAIAVYVGYQWAGEAAQTYFEVSRKHIMPGIKKIDELMVQEVQSGSQKELNKRIQDIANIAGKAEKDIMQFADSVSSIKPYSAT